MKVFVVVVGCFYVFSDAISNAKLNSMNHLKMSEKQVEKFKQLHYGWYTQAVSSVLGSVGKQMYMKMKKPERRAFVACLDAIEKEHDVKAGAKCLVKAFDGKLEKDYISAQLDPKLDFIDKQNFMPMGKLDIKKIKRKNKQKQVLKKMMRNKAQRRIRRIHTDEVVTKKYRKKMRQSLAEEYSLNEKMLRKLDKINRRRRMKRSILSLYRSKEAADEARRVDKEDRGVYRPRNAASMPNLIDTKKSPVSVVTNFIRLMFGQTNTKNIKTSYGSLKKLQDAVLKARSRSKFKNRMLDMVLGSKNPLRRPKSYTDRLRDITPEGLVDENVYGLVDSVSKHTNELNSNFLSPRFMPIMPDEYQVKKNMFSPNMFPMYKDDNDNDVLPIPNVLEKAGLNSKDRDSVLELVMDVSGVNNVVDDALNLVNGLRTEGLDGDMFDMTTLIDNAYKTLAASMTNSQNLDFANNKFSFMNGEQMRMLYGEKGVYNTSLADIPFDIEEVDRLTREQQSEALRLTIRNIAKGDGAQKDESKNRRMKRATTITLLGGFYRIVFLNPTVFSPQAFSPTTNTLSVLGPLVLSPQLFCPSVLSPLLMSLPVISPQVGNPLIFSPYVLGPNVLSAAVFNAYVFSPYVLSPNVVNPYVLSPLILSPFVLCPDVVSPTVLSGTILSPSVLSPSIFTDSALAVNVLSPTFLS